jgi:hypothetical protein
MKTGKYFFLLAVVTAILCVPTHGEVELPRPENEPILLGQPNPALAGIDKLYVVVTLLDDEPIKDGLSRGELETRIVNKLKEHSIKVTTAIAGDILNIPELRVNIETLKLKDLQQYVYCIQTSLANKVSLSNEPHLCIKADVWKTEPAMRSVSAESMPAAVTIAVLEQVEAFIHAYLAANPLGKQPFDVNDISIAPKEQVKPTTKTTPAEYKYVASKNSKVFHRPGCPSAKRIKPENLVGYSSRGEAINAGKRPCKRCKP